MATTPTDTRREPTIFTSSKVKHAHLWIALRASGRSINASWIDEARDKQSPSLPDLWRRCVQEASAADAVLLYVEVGDNLKGSLVEVGAALASGVPVFIVGEVTDSWTKHPLVHRCSTITEALEAMRPLPLMHL